MLPLSSAGAADAAAPPLFTPAPLPLVLADAAATTLFTSAPLPLVHADAAATNFLQRLLCHWCSQMLLLMQLCTPSSTTVARAVRYADVHCAPAPHPLKHIPCLGAVEVRKLFLENRFFIHKILWH